MLAKNKTDTSVQFIDASGTAFFKKETNNNVMYNEYIHKIMDMFDSKENVTHVAATISYDKIVANDYNLSVSSWLKIQER